MDALLKILKVYHNLLNKPAWLGVCLGSMLGIYITLKVIPELRDTNLKVYQYHFRKLVMFVGLILTGGIVGYVAIYTMPIWLPYFIGVSLL